MRWKREALYTILGFVEASQLSYMTARDYILIVARPALAEAYTIGSNNYQERYMEIRDREIQR